MYTNIGQGDRRLIGFSATKSKIYPRISAPTPPGFRSPQGASLPLRGATLGRHSLAAGRGTGRHRRGAEEKEMSATARTLVVAIWAVGFVAPAFAETWTAKVSLDKEKTKSPLQCLQGTITYAFELDNNTFRATNQYGRMFTMIVPEDGVIKKTYRRPGGSNAQKTFEMEGNVKSRDPRNIANHEYWRPLLLQGHARLTEQARHARQGVEFSK